MTCPVCGLEGIPDEAGFCGSCGARLGNATPVEVTPPPAADPCVRRCPACRSVRIARGGVPTWAVVVTVLGFSLLGPFSLLFLLVRDPDECMDCGAVLSKDGSGDDYV